MSQTPSKALLLAALVAASVVGCARAPGSLPSTGTKYQAVLLTTGQLYFGEVGELRDGYLRLDRVYYIQSRVDADTKQVKPTLLKRGQEWHGPGFMYINAAHILIVEPVSPQSRIAELIKESDAAK